jgi:hypothetical protein
MAGFRVIAMAAKTMVRVSFLVSKVFQDSTFMLLI